MASGDVFVLFSTVASGAYFDIQPSAGTEIVVHNLYLTTSASVTAERYNGTSFFSFTGTFSGPVNVTNLQWHCTNTQRIRLLHVTGTVSWAAAADGVYTK